MTGFRHWSFNHKCGRADNCYIDKLPDWNYIDGCFPRGIIPTDVDGMVEVNGSFLFIEEKCAGGSCKGGQLSALKALSRLDGVTVALIRPGLQSDMELNVLIDGQGTHFLKKTIEEYRQFLIEWARRAEVGPRRSRVRRELEERVVALEAQRDYFKYAYLDLSKRTGVA